jgi:hypothetical protein
MHYMAIIVFKIDEIKKDWIGMFNKWCYTTQVFEVQQNLLLRHDNKIYTLKQNDLNYILIWVF